MRIGFCSSNDRFAELFRGRDRDAMEFASRFRLHHQWKLYAIDFKNLHGVAHVRPLLQGTRQFCDPEAVRTKIAKMSVGNRQQDYFLFNEFLEIGGEWRVGWDMDKLKECAAIALDAGGKLILNEQMPPLFPEWVERWLQFPNKKWAKWRKVAGIAAELNEIHPDRVAVGVQLHSRIETAGAIVSHFPDLLGMLDGLEVHITEASCQVRDEYRDTATEFYRQTLNMAEAAGVVSYTPWWLFLESPSMPRSQYGDRTGLFPELTEDSDLADVLANPLPGWEYFEARMGG